MKNKIIHACLLLFLLASCQGIKQSSKYGFTEGYYKSRLFHKKVKSLYVIPGDDSIKVYSLKKRDKTIPDTVNKLKISFPKNGKPAEFNNYLFKQGSLDVDVLSILLKYRPAVRGFPNQLNTSILNGAFYLGHRIDFYRLSYKRSPLQAYQRNITHYGFSYGLFTGIGAARIDEYVTLNNVQIQYDGFVNPSGIAAIIAVNKLTCGLTLGIDHLLDKNNKFWIYQGKLWVGLSVGLNLN